ILVAIPTAVAPSAKEALTLVSRVLSLTSAVGYYIGFSPPRWVRQAWQMAEFREFLRGLDAESATARLSATLDRLGPAATRAVGGKAAFVAVCEPEADDAALRLHGSGEPLDLSGSPDVGVAWRENKPLATTEPRRWGTALRPLAEAAGGAHTALVAPLSAHNARYGVLIVLLEQRSLFVEDELDLLSAFAEQAALAMEAGRLFRATERSASERQALLSLSQALAEQSDLAVIADRIGEQVSELFPATSWKLLVKVQDEDPLEVVATHGTGETERVGRRISDAHGISGQVFRTGEPVLLGDVRTAVNYAGPDPNVRSLLIVPLLYHQTPLGVMVLESQRVAAFTPDHQALASIMAADAAVAVARAQLVERLRQQNVLVERANRMKSEFLANMSHELRTPLNAIIGFSEVLLDPDLSEMPDEQRAEFLENIHRSGKHLLGLINDILDLSKVEAGRMELHPEPLGLSQLIQGCLDIVKPLAAKKHIQLHGACEPAELMVYADAARVKQVLYNLLSNAVKFTPDGGRVSVDASVQGEEVHVAVTDTGVGIASEDRELVFEEFRQVDGAATREQEGTGLGLALVRRLVELHGGRIWLRSTVGEGSTFTFALPIEPAREVGEPKAAPAKEATPLPVRESQGGLPVVIIEDERAAAELLTLHLTRAGYDVHRAASAAEAVGLIKEVKPFAITLDVLMPDRDGWDILASLKSDPETRDIPVIVVSVVDNRELGFALGASDYLVKPIDRRALLGALERLIAQRPAGAQPVVLAVDDDPSALQLVAHVLQGSECELVTAGGGVEALEVLRSRSIDLVLLDLMMPEVSGFDVLREMRASSRTSHIPVVVCTAKDLTRQEQAELRGQVESIVQKGTGPSDLLLELLQLERFYPRLADIVGGPSGHAVSGNFLPHLERELSRAERHQRPFSLLAAALRDAEGHNGHDLAPLCDAFNGVLRRYDLAAHDGEEVLVLLPETPPEQAQTVAQKLKSAAEPLTAEWQSQLRFGLASYPAEAQVAPELLHRARSRLAEVERDAC
ncbi:MAG: response regulator, partial [Chloroflexi bacterium]|nr:response regulator [Chloroflexota bacterium]